jgi:hypothetical protein
MSLLDACELLLGVGKAFVDEACQGRQQADVMELGFLRTHGSNIAR